MNPHPALPRKRGREIKRTWLLLDGRVLVVGQDWGAMVYDPSAS
jgi:hypothetical protein